MADQSAADTCPLCSARAGERGRRLDDCTVAGGDAADQRGQRQHHGVVVGADDKRRAQGTERP